ncbi:MAG: PIN domain-containing protein [Blautia sp.]|nr:PIN domain-containing protein [Blautia sp.]MCM1200265.1 PIN domain-containing protein [Bacteroides fragilis]
MKKYLLDTNAYFALLKYIGKDEKNEFITNILAGECYISKVTQIEIISVIGKYARGVSRGSQMCNRICKDTGMMCGKQFMIPEQKKWSQAKLKGWLKLEKEVSSGSNCLFNVKVLELNSDVIAEAENFIQNALLYNFKSMDAVILGTAKANSSDTETMIVVTADKALKAGMDKIKYPYMSIA